MIISPAWNQRVKDMQICLILKVWEMRFHFSKHIGALNSQETLSMNVK